MGLVYNGRIEANRNDDSNDDSDEMRQDLASARPPNRVRPCR